MGVCVFGQGDCSDKINVISNTFNKTLNENIKQTMISKADNTGAKLAGTQMVDIGDIKGVGCRVIIGPITQKMVFKYSFSKMSERISKSEFESQMKEDLKKTINSDSNVKKEFLGGSGQDVNITDTTMNENINRVVNSFDYSDFQTLTTEMDAKQRVGLSGIEMDCTPFILAGRPDLAEIRIESIDQDMVLDVMVQKMAKELSEEFVKLMQDNTRATDVGVKATTEVTGVRDVGRGIGDIAEGVGSGVGAAGSGIISGLMTPILIIVGLIIFVILVGLLLKFATAAPAPDVSYQPVEQDYVVVGED
jgi:hypothetical protein